MPVWHLLNVLFQMLGLCMVQFDLLPSPPPPASWQPPRQVQPFGPGGGELFEAVLSQGYEGGANKK